MQNFNSIITGVGGQGLITLLKILAEAALIENFDVRTSELHGLSQREGSVSVHIRFGQEIFSPLITPGKANLILALEMTEVLRAIDFSNKETVFLINKKLIPYFEGPTEKKVLKEIKKIPAKTYLIKASEICKEKIGIEVLAGVFLLGVAVSKKIIPFSSDIIIKAIKRSLPKEFSFKENKKAFLLGQKYE